MASGDPWVPIPTYIYITSIPTRLKICQLPWGFFYSGRKLTFRVHWYNVSIKYFLMPSPNIGIIQCHVFILIAFPASIYFIEWQDALCISLQKILCQACNHEMICDPLVAPPCNCLQSGGGNPERDLGMKNQTGETGASIQDESWVIHPFHLQSDQFCAI